VRKIGLDTTPYKIVKLHIVNNSLLSMKKIFTLSIILFLFLPFYFVLAFDYSFKDNFETFDIGSIADQNGWTGNCVVENSIFNSGTKAISLSFGNSCLKYFDTAISGNIFLYFNTDDNSVVSFSGGGDDDDIFYIDANAGSLNYFNGHDFLAFSTYSVNQWHKLIIEWDGAIPHYRFKLDNGSFSDWFAVITSDNNAKYLQIFNGVSGTSYVDDINYTEVSNNNVIIPTTTANVSSMLGYAGGIFQDLNNWIIIAIAVPVAFYVVSKIIETAKPK